MGNPGKKCIDKTTSIRAVFLLPAPPNRSKLSRQESSDVTRVTRDKARIYESRRGEECIFLNMNTLRRVYLGINSSFLPSIDYRPIVLTSSDIKFCIPKKSCGRAQLSRDKSKRMHYSWVTWTIFVISCISITPLPSTSYIRNAHFSFSSGVPLDVTSIASRNSCNKSRWYPASVTSSQLGYQNFYFLATKEPLPFVRNENLFYRKCIYNTRMFTKGGPRLRNTII